MCAALSTQEVADDVSVTQFSPATPENSTGQCRRNYGAYFNDQRFSDLKLEVGSKTFHVSKLILVSESQIFYDMLCKDSGEENTNTIRIEDVDENIFEAILKFIYTGVLPSEMDDTEISEWLLAINKYGFFILKVRHNLVFKFNFTN